MTDATESSPGFLLDTNVWNAICDNLVTIERWSDRGPVYATKHQPREFAQSKAVRYEQLVTLYSNVGPVEADTASARAAALAVNDYAFPPSWELVELVASRLGGITERKKRANWTDGLLAECAFALGLVLVTADRKLARTATALGVAVELVELP